jgi:hypothetical protein
MSPRPGSSDYETPVFPDRGFFVRRYDLSLSFPIELKANRTSPDTGELATYTP